MPAAKSKSKTDKAVEPPISFEDSLAQNDNWTVAMANPNSEM